MTLTQFLEAEVDVSLDGTATYTGDDDALTPNVKADPGISTDEGRDGAQQLNPPKIAAGGFSLRNENGQFSDTNATSVYYQRFLPGKPVRYQAGHGERRTWRSHTLWRDHVYFRGRGVWPLGQHVIDDLNQTTEIGQRQVAVTTLGYETILTRATVSVGVMTAPRVDQCFTALLDAVGWPATKRAISVADTTLLYWWCDERHPWDAMLELMASEGPGTFYISRDGVFHFENRNYRTITARSTTSQATFWDRQAGSQTAWRSHVLWRDHRLYRGRTSTLSFSQFKPANPFRSIYNRATYSTKRRTAGTPGIVIWSAGANIALTASQVLTLIARPSDPFQTAIVPILTTDYTVSGGTVSVSLSATSGLVAFITVTATSGTPTVSSLQLRATPLTVVSETVAQNSVDASASIAAFSPIPGQNIPLTLPVAGWPEISTVQAAAVCDAWVLRQERPRTQITFVLQNGSEQLLEQILSRQPSDRITLIHQQSGLTADFWINSLTLHISGAGGRTVELTVGAESCDDLTGAVWDLSLWSGVSSTWGI